MCELRRICVLSIECQQQEEEYHEYGDGGEPLMRRHMLILFLYPTGRFDIYIDDDVLVYHSIALVIVGAPSSASRGFRQESEDRSAGVLFS